MGANFENRPTKPSIRLPLHRHRIRQRTERCDIDRPAGWLRGDQPGGRLAFDGDADRFSGRRQRDQFAKTCSGFGKFDGPHSVAS